MNQKKTHTKVNRITIKEYLWQVGNHLQSDYINGGAQRRTSQPSLYCALLLLSLSIYLFMASKRKKKKKKKQSTCEEKWQKKEKKRKASKGPLLLTAR
jgi:hypothetical protein